MPQKTLPFILMFMSLALSACSHETLKAPCSPLASLEDSPCASFPINIASR